MYSLIKSFLFLLSPENAHLFTTWFLRIVFRIPFIKPLVTSLYNLENPKLKKSLMGLEFPNPVGLAAGFDKNAKYLHEFQVFGFGFIEIGTLTPKAQPGNPKPRLFRIPADQALINRMGFNNHGVEIATEKLKRRPENLIIGGNIGKNKETPNNMAEQDYIRCFETLYPYVDYFVVNVSSPNTPGLRQLQDKEPLTNLLNNLQVLNREKKDQKPILLKIAPDLTDDQLDDILEIVSETGIDGIIATNTTISREGLSLPQDRIKKIGEGGLSGLPVQARSTDVIRYIRSKNKKMVVIGVGGIHDGKSALEKINAGADLIQIYTGFIFKGPSLIRDINRAILNNIDEG